MSKPRKNLKDPKLKRAILKDVRAGMAFKAVAKKHGVTSHFVWQMAGDEVHFTDII